MIRYRYKNARILFVGINPHPGSFSRSVPFSNNKMFWYLLSDAGLLKETRDELRDDDLLRRLYSEAFNPLYRLGFVNIIDRPTRDITEIRRGEEISGRAKISRIIKAEAPRVVCFIGKVAYEKYSGLERVSPLAGKTPLPCRGSLSCISPCAAKLSSGSANYGRSNEPQSNDGVRRRSASTRRRGRGASGFTAGP